MGVGIGGKCTFSDETPTHICIHFIFIANKCIALHFPSNDIGLSLLKFFWWAPEFLFTSTRGRFRRSMASKVTDIGANRKCGVDFLLVRNSNDGPILHHFGDMTGFMCYLPHPYSTLILGVFPLHHIAHVGDSQSRGLKLFGHEFIFEIFQPIWKSYINVTNRRTDGQTDDMQSHNRALRSIVR